MTPTLSSRAYLYLFLFIIVGPVTFTLGQSFFGATVSDNETWSFILDSMFWDLTKNTVILALLTVAFTCALGFAQAFLICFTDIPGKNYLHLLFILPLIFPLYVLGFIYVGSFEYSGAIPTMIREFLGINLNSIFNIKSVWGVAQVFGLVLAPYVYLYVKSAFEAMDEKLFLSARSLGKSTFDIIRTLIIPQSLPWIFSGAILVCLEVFCDFGGVSVFNYETFSTAVYHAWISLFSINTAIKLSFFPTLVALGLYVVNQYWFKVKTGKSRKNKGYALIKLKAPHRFFIYSLLGVFSAASLFFPIGQLIIWSIQSLSVELNSDYFLLILETFGIGLVIAIGMTLLSLLFVYFYRFRFNKAEESMTPFTKIGYAIPGSIIAISLMSLTSLFKINFAGGMALLILALAYLTKFFSVPSEILKRGLEAINVKLDWSSTSLGKTEWQTFKHIHMALIAPVIFSSAVMVLIEVFKEMPMTLILRPFGVNTLATRIYELTSEGEWERASLSAVFLLLLGAVSLYLSEKVMRKN